MLVGGSHLPGGVVVEVTQETSAGTHCVRHGAVKSQLIIIAIRVLFSAQIWTKHIGDALHGLL